MKYNLNNQILKPKVKIYFDKSAGKNDGYVNGGLLLYYVRGSRNGKSEQIKFTSGIKLERLNWDVDSQKVINHDKASVINHELEITSNNILSTVLAILKDNPELSLSEIKNMFQYQFQNIFDSKYNVFDYIEKFTDSFAFVPNEIRNDNKFVKYKDDKIISKSIKSKLKNLSLRIGNFLESNFTGVEIIPEIVNNDFCNKYFNYFVHSADYSHNTIKREIRLIKKYMLWLNENNYIRCYEYEKIKVSLTPPKKVLSIRKNEIDKIIDLEFTGKSDSKYLELDDDNFNLEKLYEVRDLILLQFYTGLRVSDLLGLKYSNSDIDRGYLNLLTFKNNQTVVIPLNELTTEILRKYIEIGIPKISVNTYNKYISAVFRLSGLNGSVSIKKPMKKLKIIPLYESITSHVLRRSFITTALNNNMDKNILGKITGKNYKDVYIDYYGLKIEDIINGYNKIFRFNIRGKSTPDNVIPFQNTFKRV